MLREAQLQRLERAVTPLLRTGWARAVFAAPQAEGDAPLPGEQVVPGPGPGVAPTPPQLAELFKSARAAANAGLFKHTYVLDERRRVQVDARHGRPTVRTLDPETARKVMGGKDRPLRPDASNALLRAIGIMNADGTISANHARKYKQVNHLAGLCRPTTERLLAARPRTPADPLRVLDLACGNAYLSFVLAESLRLEGVPLRLHGVDVRDDVVTRSRERAAALGMLHTAATGPASPHAPADPASPHAATGLSFARATIAEAEAAAPAVLGGPPDIVLALHACDTATDEALALAIRLGAPAILSVPCCQHELAAQLAARKAPTAPDLPLALHDHGLLRSAYADLLTDALRVDLLEACGYDVAVVEFVGSEHTAKNILLRAHRRHPGARPDPTRWRLAPIQARCASLGVDPDLLRRLLAASRPPPDGDTTTGPPREPRPA